MLYIISTPIGNLKDISLRALEVLEKVEVLLCEDTRKTGIMLQRLGVKNKPKLVPYYDQVEEKRTVEAVAWLKAGMEVGLVSNAGTPLLSDPGFRLVRRCQGLGLEYTAIPGASAVINALILAGMGTARFCFLGFLPKKPNARKNLLKKYADFEGPKVVYESPFRIEKLVGEIESVYGQETEVTVCREMTKKFEQVIRGTPDEVLLQFKKSKFKGEATVIFCS